MKRALFAMITILVLATVLLSNWLSEERAENSRLRNNQLALYEKCQVYENKLGESAATVARLQVTKDELEDHYSLVSQEAEAMRIQIKRLQSASTTGSDTRLQISAQIRDSVVIRYIDQYPVTTDTIKAFFWGDPWTRIRGEIRADTAKVDIASTDTIVQIVHRVPKKFWFFRWGTKAIRQEIACRNPHTRVTYTEYLELTP